MSEVCYECVLLYIVFYFSRKLIFFFFGCHSSSVIMKNQPAHVLYKSEDNFLVLIAMPKIKLSLKEATYIVNDVISSLLFNHQTLRRYYFKGFN